MGDFNGDSSEGSMPMLEVDVLIVGAGPSGGSLACFLGSYGTSLRE
jgi:ribulose 1,5-bisphosphate synthetase/thiazole synthase